MPQQNLIDLLQDLEKLATAKSTVTVSDLFDALGSRSYGPFFIVPAFIEISPIGGIPGVPTLISLIIIIFSVQIILGRSSIWLPQKLSNREIKTPKIKAFTRKAERPVAWLDKKLQQHWVFLTRPPFTQLIALICLALALTMPTLEVIPFASTIPAFLILLFGCALLISNGLLILITAVLTSGAGLFGFYQLF